jgi:hypothetical protein
MVAEDVALITAKGMETRVVGVIWEGEGEREMRM